MLKTSLRFIVLLALLLAHPSHGAGADDPAALFGPEPELIDPETPGNLDHVGLLNDMGDLNPVGQLDHVDHLAHGGGFHRSGTGHLALRDLGEVPRPEQQPHGVRVPTSTELMAGRTIHARLSPPDEPRRGQHG